LTDWAGAFDNLTGRLAQAKLERKLKKDRWEGGPTGVRKKKGKAKKANRMASRKGAGGWWSFKRGGGGERRRTNNSKKKKIQKKKKIWKTKNKQTRPLEFFSTVGFFRHPKKNNPSSLFLSKEPGFFFKNHSTGVKNRFEEENIKWRIWLNFMWVFFLFLFLDFYLLSIAWCLWIAESAAPRSWVEIASIWGGEAQGERPRSPSPAGNQWVSLSLFFLLFFFLSFILFYFFSPLFFFESNSNLPFHSAQERSSQPTQAKGAVAAPGSQPQGDFSNQWFQQQQQPHALLCWTSYSVSL